MSSWFGGSSSPAAPAARESGGAGASVSSVPPSSSSSSSSKASSNNASSLVSAAEAQRAMDAMQAQSNLQSLLIDGFAHAFAACTSKDTLERLSKSETRCVRLAMDNYVDARSHIAQQLAASYAAAGGDF